ncbi:MAG: SAM-dependent methyltransferase, partial [Candidatus Omnitrophota bacterium]
MPNLKAFIKKYLADPMAEGLDIDDPTTVIKHRQMIESKPLLKKIYRDWYQEYAASIKTTQSLNGPLIEIGSGAGFSKTIYPQMITTDITEAPYVDKVLDAQNMAYADQSVRGFFLINVVHHFLKPANFFKEVERTLMPGGRLVMLEPYNSPFNRLLCSNMDHYEYFDIIDASWEANDQSRMSKANMALTWNILIRDHERFKKAFPDLEIQSIKAHTFLAYILSGGMSYKSFLPAFMSPCINFIE